MGARACRMIGSMSDVRFKLLELTVGDHHNIVADFLLFQCLASTNTLGIGRPVGRQRRRQHKLAQQYLPTSDGSESLWDDCVNCLFK